jgi:hypothetical protein
MYPHPIQLVGPWVRIDSQGQTSGTLVLPSFIRWEGDPAERATYRRTFQWVGPPRPDERILLVREGVIGPASWQLNGGPIHDIGSLTRVDITAQIRPRNELTLTFEPAPGSAERWVGLEGSIGLEVTSAKLTDAWVEWEWDEPSSPRALAGRLQLDSGGLPTGSELVVELNQHEVVRFGIDETRAGKGPLGRGWDFHAGPFDLDPWRPQPLGWPIRQNLTWSIRAGGEILWQREHQVGFRRLHPGGKNDASRIICGQEELSAPEQTVRGTDSIAFVPRWRSLLSEGRGRWDLQGHLASSDLYDLADRRGVVIVHHSAPSPVLRLTHHPSVVIASRRDPLP